MGHANVGQVTLDYETYGDPDDPALLLIMGLAAQRTWWPDELVDHLANRGLRVITFDNRDVGRSTVLTEAGGSMDEILAAYGGQAPDPPYTLSDMATDAVSLLDHLGVDAAHVVGASMGGMIAQTIAIEHPERVRTLTSIMSTTGAPDVGLPTEEAIGALLTPRPADREGFIKTAIETARVLATRPLFDEEAARARAAETFDRGWHPDGVVRQLLAILAQPDRTDELRRLDVPTLVIHGDADILIGPDGGQATAAAVPAARLELIEGMGHDLPAALLPRLGDLLADHVQGRAREGVA